MDMLKHIAKSIDHTLLKPDATKEQIEVLCEEAKVYQFASVCVNPVWVDYAANLLKRTDVKVCTVIGFPLGSNTIRTKAFETEDAIAKGAEEIDMVINIGLLKSGDIAQINQEIQAVVKAANKSLVKVIIETSLLTYEEKEIACLTAKQAGADFVKTSTGFSSGGATIEDVALMRKVVGKHVGVKASGGVRSLEDAKKMIQAGATRIGTSSGVSIMKQLSSFNKFN